MKVSQALALIAVWSGLAMAPAMLVFALLGGGGSTAGAQGPIIIAIDMDPQNTPANSCQGDGVTDCTTGTIERCISVLATQGTTFTIDGLVKGLSNGHAGWAWDLAFPDAASAAKLTMIAQVETASQVNLISQSVASMPGGTIEIVPDSISPHTTSLIDLSSSETTPPFT